MSNNSQVITRGINELLAHGRTSVPHYAFQTLSQTALEELGIKVERRDNRKSRWAKVVRVARAGETLRAGLHESERRQAA